MERSFQALTDVLEDAESGQRGYLLTDDIRHLKSYEQTREAADVPGNRTARRLTGRRPGASDRRVLPGVSLLPTRQYSCLVS